MSLFAERYDLFEELGSGGYGVVHRAHDHNTGREVALKIFRGGIRPGIAFREAHMLTALEGPHILRVFDADVWNDIAHIASAVARGGTAEQQLSPHPQGLPANVAILWLSNLLHGLDETHRAGLIHRDIKPGNVFLDSHEHARLGDFGVAETPSAGKVPAGGDMRVRAPEMWDTGLADNRADIYSVGATAWRLLTGAWPFPASKTTTQAEYSSWVLAGLPKRLRDVAPHVPSMVARVVEKSLARDPDDRHQTAHEMAVDLGRLPVPGRWWSELSPHHGHSRCWLGSTTSGSRSSVRVCVSIDPALGKAEVIVTKGASGNRVKEFCRHVPERNLSVALRNTFDHA